MSPPLLTSCAVYDELILINSPLYRRVSDTRRERIIQTQVISDLAQIASVRTMLKSVDKIRQRHVSLLRIVPRRFPEMVIAEEIIADDSVLQLKPQLLQHE